MPENFDQDHVMYVWFDALTSYLTGSQALVGGRTINSFILILIHSYIVRASSHSFLPSRLEIEG